MLDQAPRLLIEVTIHIFICDDIGIELENGFISENKRARISYEQCYDSPMRFF